MKTNQNVPVDPENAEHKQGTSYHILAILALFLLCGCPKIAKAQTPVTITPFSAMQPFLDVSGRPLAGGKICVYLAGTSTPAPTYTDSSGNFQQSNPILLDAGGFSPIWLASGSYKFVLLTAGTTTDCTTGAQQRVLDNVTTPIFANGNNNFTGNETHSGAEVFNGAVTLNFGGSMSGAFSGSPTFSGNPTFSASPVFSGIPLFSNQLQTDAISGTLTGGGTFTVTGGNGAGASAGESLAVLGGTGGPTAGVGGAVTIQGGAGGASGGAGGNVNGNGGNATSGNANGGSITFAGGNGVGTGHGGDFAFNGSPGGSTAGRGSAATLQGGQGGAGGNGGDISLIPGALGAGGVDGSVILGQSGRLKFNNDTAAVAPGCTSTGVGSTGSCIMNVFSTDTSGQMILTAGGAGIAATGLVTLTFHASMGGHGSYCLASLAQGTGTWGTASTVIIVSDVSATATMTWTDSTGALTTAQGYAINYWCRGII